MWPTSWIADLSGDHLKDPRIRICISSMLLLWSFWWLLQSLAVCQSAPAAAEEAAAATTSTEWCQAIAYPATNVDYELVQLDASHLNRVALQDLLMQNYCLQKRMPIQKCDLTVDRVHQLLQRKMVDFDVYEMLVNVSFDRSMSFTLDLESFKIPSAIKPSSSWFGSLFSSSSSSSSLDPPNGRIEVFPEAKNGTASVQEFCDDYELPTTTCESIHVRIQEALIAQWGCEQFAVPDGDVSANETAPGLENATAEESGLVESQLTGESRLQLARQQIQAQQSLIIPVRLDDTSKARVMLHLQVQNQSVELQIAQFCWRHVLEMDGCVKLYQVAMEALAKRELTDQNQRVQTIEFQSPLSTRLYPGKEMVFIEFTWQQTPPSNQHICVHLDYDLQPAYCGLALEKRKPLYFTRLSGAIGDHLILIRQQKPEEQEADFVPDPTEYDVQVDGETDKKTPTQQRARERFLRAHTLLGATFMHVVNPTVELSGVGLTSASQKPEIAKQVDHHVSDLDKQMFLQVTLQVRSLDLLDQVYRLCMVHNLRLSCWNTSALTITSSSSSSSSLDNDLERTEDESVTLITAPIFGMETRLHEFFFLLMNQFNKAFAKTPLHSFRVKLAQDTVGMEPIPQFFLPPQVPSKPSDRTRCQESLMALRETTKDLLWLCDLWQNEFGYFSQNGEDGILLEIFNRVGITNLEYVEFGAADGQECNTRFLRELYGWRGLLMDSGYSDDSINLQKELVTPSNINELFVKYNVSAEFDLLSIDIDFADYHVLNALDTTAFSPRVIVVEYNSHIPFDEPRTVQYGDEFDVAWDGNSDYFGAGIAAFSKWGQQRGYSLVYCESHGVNCFLVRNDALGIDNTGQLVLPLEDIVAPPNFFGKGWSYPNVTQGEKPWIWV